MLVLLMAGSPPVSIGSHPGVRRFSVKDADIKRLRVGSLVRYTHFGRHETTKATGVVVEIMDWDYGSGTFADIRWFDGLSGGHHNVAYDNLSLISA